MSLQDGLRHSFARQLEGISGDEILSVASYVLTPPDSELTESKVRATLEIGPWGPVVYTISDKVDPGTWLVVATHSARILVVASRASWVTLGVDPPERVYEWARDILAHGEERIILGAALGGRH